jgi:hypothetical protein
VGGFQMGQARLERLDAPIQARISGQAGGQTRSSDSSPQSPSPPSSCGPRLLPPRRLPLGVGLGVHCRNLQALFDGGRTRGEGTRPTSEIESPLYSVFRALQGIQC